MDRSEIPPRELPAGRAPTAAVESSHRPKSTRRPPDPGAMRLAYGIGGLAALSALTTAIIAPASGLAAAAAPPQLRGAAAPASVAVRRQVVYVQLSPGQSPPPGAKVISAAAPKPVTVVTTVPAPAQRPVIVRTTQSGKVLP